MGARMLRDQLHRDGVQVRRRHITTLMQRMDIEALAPQPGTSKRAPGHHIYPYLLRTLTITCSNQVCALAHGTGRPRSSAPTRAASSPPRR